MVASWIDQHLTEWIQPEMLRAPEVTLGADWDYKVDIWNLGLIVASPSLQIPALSTSIITFSGQIWELAEGALLFDGSWSPKDQYTPEAHLAQITAILGSIPTRFLERCEDRDVYFDAAGMYAPLGLRGTVTALAEEWLTCVGHLFKPSPWSLWSLE